MLVSNRQRHCVGGQPGDNDRIGQRGGMAFRRTPNRRGALYVRAWLPIFDTPNLGPLFSDALLGLMDLMEPDGTHSDSDPPAPLFSLASVGALALLLAAKANGAGGLAADGEPATAHRALLGHEVGVLLSSSLLPGILHRPSNSSAALAN